MNSTDPLSWPALVGRRVGLWGLGVEGRANLARLENLGNPPAVVVDGTPGHTSSGLPILSGQDGLTALAGCEVVIMSPGISPYDEPAQRLRAQGVRLVGGLGLWLAEQVELGRGSRILAVTGTKGKSTTTSIAGALIRGLGHTCLIGGNLGHPPWAETGQPQQQADWIVVEVSSYQAYHLQVGPAVVVLTSLDQDHLTWHHGYPNYVADKLSLATRPGVRTVIAPATDPELRRHAELLGPHVGWVDSDPILRHGTPAWLDALGLLGAHNQRNALLARAALLALGVPGADDENALAAAASEYEPLPSRLTRVAIRGGVEFVDDSLSTNVLPTLAAVAAFPRRRVALLAGGFDRGIDYRPLGHGLAERALGVDGAPVLVLTLPDNGPRVAAEIAEAAAGTGSWGSGLVVEEATDLSAAVRRAAAWAAPDGVVLLSPAAPSFGVFADYAERAAVFADAVAALD